MADNPEVDAVDDELGRWPSIGQMIANGGRPPYVPAGGDASVDAPSTGPTAAMPQPVNAPSGRTSAPMSQPVTAPDVRPQIDPAKLPDSIRPYQPKATDIPTPPTGAGNPNLSALAKRQAELSTPINPYDQATGKVKPQYKMGTGQRILGLAADALNGFARNGQQSVYVGPGATNWRFGREEAAREGELGGVNEQIKTQEQIDAENEKGYRDAIKQAYEGQLGEARQATAKAQQETADTRAKLEQTAADLNTAKANAANAKANQKPEPKTEVEVATALETAKASGDKAGVAKWQAVLNEVANQKRAAKDTSATDVSRAIQVAEYRGREHDRVAADKEKERTARYTELDKDLTLKYSPEKMAAAKAKVDGDLEAKYGPKDQAVDNEADKMLGLTKSGKTLQSAPRAAANRPAPVKIDPNNLPKRVMVNGKARQVVGYNAQTKKVILAPEGQ